MKQAENFSHFEIGEPRPGGCPGETMCVFSADTLLEVIKEFVALGCPEDHWIDEWRIVRGLPYPVRELDLETGVWMYWELEESENDARIMNNDAKKERANRKLKEHRTTVKKEAL